LTKLKNQAKINQEEETMNKNKICLIGVISASALLFAGVLSGCAKSSTKNNNKNNTEAITAIINAQIFDGERIIDENVVVIKGDSIYAIGGEIPAGANIVDAQGGTLLPGLIDSHTHTDMDGLADALRFGVTTELEMNGNWSMKQRKKIAERTDVADLRSPGMGVTARGGHPTEYAAESGAIMRVYVRHFFPSVKTPEEAIKFVDTQIGKGADYIKVFIEDGSYIGYPGLPVLDNQTLKAAVDESHRNNKMAIAHVTTLDGGRQAIAAGVNGLAHLFFDKQPDAQFIEAITSSGAFVIPTLVTLSTAFGNDASALAADERVRSRIDEKWLVSLSRSMNVHPQGKMEDAFAAVMELYGAGVDILAGSDVSEPLPTLGGLAHGASLHHELRLLVDAGLTPVQALMAATSVPARRFGLAGRGRIAPGLRADLLLVSGDPLGNISDTLSVNAVWKKGVRLAEPEVANRTKE
jgi:imidazolonepropionase-like amidohydrolase